MSAVLEAPISELSEEKAKQLLDAGVHYGQPISKRSPKMDEFVYGVSSNGIQIIDLDLTWQKLQEAGALLRKLSTEDKNIVFVGTNERAVSATLQDYADNFDLHYITNRWLGGTLTNPVTRNRINYLRELEGMEISGLINSLSAKEKSMMLKKLKKLRRNLGGLKKVKGAIHAIVLIDPVHESNATLEALKKSKNLAIIAVADTNCNFDPKLFDIVIPCNTSSLSSLKVVMDELVKNMEEGKLQGRQTASAISQGPSRKSSGSGVKPTGAVRRKPAEIKAEAKTQDASSEA